MEDEEFEMNEIDVAENLDPLFDLNLKVSVAHPHLLPLRTEKQFLNFLIKDHGVSRTWLLKDSKGNFIAYVSLVDKPKEGVMEVLIISVEPTHQRRGLGRRLMEFAEKRATELGRKRVELVVNKKNEQALGFYNHIGYSIVREIPNYYGDGETRYLCRKILAS